MLTNLLLIIARDRYCFQQTIVDQAYGSPLLILYSHIPIAIITLIVGIFLLTRNNKLETQIFFLLAFTFSLFTLGDFMEWFMFIGRDAVMFARSIIELLDPVLFILSSYFLFVLITKRDVWLVYKILWLLPLAPLIIRLFLNQNLTGYNWEICEVVESSFSAAYVYYIDLFYIVSAILFGIWSIIRGKGHRKEISVATMGVFSFIASFFLMEYVFSGYILGGVFDFNYFLYAFFGMPILIVFLAYLTIEFHTFNVKMITAQILVWGAVALVFSQFFFLDNTTSLILNGVNIFLVAILGDLTTRNVKREIEQRKKIEKLAIDLEKANSDLKELDHQKDELIGIVSHQLATPVTSVKWYLEMLAGGDMGALTKDQIDHVKSTQSVVSHLVELVGMILDVSRIQLGKMKVDKQDLDLNIFFTELMEVIEPRAQEKGVEFVKLMPAKLPVAKLDKRLTNMTIENLLSNAVKYTPKGGKVEVKIELRDGKMFFSVKDSGVGIPEKDQGKIFDKLYRASNVRNTVEGNGFGLYVAKGAVEGQGGSLSFKSIEGKGTTFFVELPLV